MHVCGAESSPMWVRETGPGCATLDQEACDSLVVHAVFTYIIEMATRGYVVEDISFHESSFNVDAATPPGLSHH